MIKVITAHYIPRTQRAELGAVLGEQVEYWIHLARNHAPPLACLRHGHDPTFGRRFDQLPPEVLDDLAGSLVATMTVPELRRALTAVTTTLLSAVGDLPAVKQVEPLIEGLCRSICGESGQGLSSATQASG